MEHIKQHLAMIAVICLTIIGMIIKQSEPLLGMVLVLAGSMIAFVHYVIDQNNRWPWLAFWAVFVIIDLYRLLNLI